MRSGFGQGFVVSSNEDGLHFGLLALLGLGDAPLENLTSTREAQRAIVRIQIAEVRAAREAGASWADVAEALQIPEELARERFEPRAPW